MTDPHLTPRRQPAAAAAAFRPKALAEFVGQAGAREPNGLAAALTASMELP